MLNLTNTNGLLSFSQNDILVRDFIKNYIILNVQNILKNQNRGWLFEEIESTSIIPDSMISSEYNKEDYFQIDDKLSLKPETTATSYKYAIHLMTNNFQRAPLCVYQASKSFRNEQDQVLKNMRLKEFYQLEFQCIYSIGTRNDYQANTINDLGKCVKELLKLNTRIVLSDRLPSYSKKTLDIEVFNGDKWMEICSVSVRNDFDDKHEVLEIAFGLDRLLYNYNKAISVFDINFMQL